MGEMIVMNINGQDVVAEFKVTKEEKESLIAAADNKQLIRYLIDQYEQSQQYRIRGENQIRAYVQGADIANDDGIEHRLFINKQKKLAIAQEAMNKRYMDIITSEIPFCQWAKSICGIGPVLSAYLYATFDIGNGRYATDFMSYAGLNDNRNPWLGEAKGKALATKVQNEVIEEINTHMQPLLDAYRNASGDSECKKLNAKLKKINLLDEDLVSEVGAIVSALTHGDGTCTMELARLAEDISYLHEYVELAKNPSACTDTMLLYAANETGRKYVNVKKGVQTTNNVKKNKKAIITVADLGSYLAKPPYNKGCKCRMRQIGESFKKQCKRPRSLYGHLYAERKAYEVAKNNNRDYADQAARLLSEKDYSKNTDTYEYLIDGKLSPAHLDARALRWATKLFLSHVHEAMWWAKYHTAPPIPYIIAYGEHHDYVAPEVDYKEFIS